MDKSIKLLLTAALLIGGISSAVFAASPLSSYDLYADTHRNSGDDERANVMSEYYHNSLAAKKNRSQNSSNSSSYSASTSNTYTNTSRTSSGTQRSTGMRRNEYLRQSSSKRFGGSKEAEWETEPMYYPEPSMDNIISKYRASNFTGCQQEAASYVRLHPDETLAFYYMAMSYAKMGDRENAIKAYERVIDLRDNPLIVKYATNGRNCVMNGSPDRCYQDVNLPDYYYPYENAARYVDLTPIDPEELANKNFEQIQNKIAPNKKAKKGEAAEGKSGGNSIFKSQDSELDEFIKAPYGTGLSPQLEKEVKQQQLKKFQETINQKDSSEEEKYNEIQNIRKFDNKKSESETIKLAYTPTNEQLSQLANDPEYIEAQKQMEELRFLLGNDTPRSGNDINDLIPYYSEKGKNISPEVLKIMMMKSTMSDFGFDNGSLL